MTDASRLTDKSSGGTLIIRIGGFERVSRIGALEYRYPQADDAKDLPAFCAAFVESPTERHRIYIGEDAPWREKTWREKTQ